MPLPTVSFLLGLVLTLYLSTFLVFALLRVVTGFSIQRIGYSGLRRIAFSPRNGIHVRIRGLGLSVHRPTFAQPTWISINVTELQVSINLRALASGQKSAGTHAATSDGSIEGSPSLGPGTKRRDATTAREARTRRWQRLLGWKERLKRLHREVEWLRLVDLVVLRSSLEVKDVGSARIDRFTLSVDTRPKTVDRSRLFQHHHPKAETKRPAEWKSLTRSILVTPEGKEPTEILDYCTFSAHGFLRDDVEGLRDASIALKIGRLNIPYDDLESARHSVQQMLATMTTDTESPETPKISVNGEQQSTSDPTDVYAAILEAISDSKDFVNSIMRGIQEVQLAVGFLGLSKRIRSVRTGGQPVYFLSLIHI